MTVRTDRICGARNSWIGATCIIDPSRHRGCSHFGPDRSGRYREWPQVADLTSPPAVGQQAAGFPFPAATIARDDGFPKAAADGARGAGVTADCASRSPIEATR